MRHLSSSLETSCLSANEDRISDHTVDLRDSFSPSAFSMVAERLSIGGAEDDDVIFEETVDVDLAEEEQTEDIEEPRKHLVVMINDDFTPFPFVEQVLIRIYGKSEEEAGAIAMTVHSKGECVVGVYSREVAETKIAQTHAVARQEGHPLLCEMRPEEPRPNRSRGPGF